MGVDIAGTGVDGGAIGCAIDGDITGVDDGGVNDGDITGVDDGDITGVDDGGVNDGVNDGVDDGDITCVDDDVSDGDIYRGGDGDLYQLKKRWMRRHHDNLLFVPIPIFNSKYIYYQYNTIFFYNLYYLTVFDS
jgi:hypothetical protein